MRIESIEAFLKVLKGELRGSDPATVQDALFDAEDHLRSALESARAEDPDTEEQKALQAIFASYGSPAETAAAYREIEQRVDPALTKPAGSAERNLAARFFSVYIDPAAWAALLYLLVSLLTGVVFFSWAVTGLSVSIATSIFIFGLPLAAFFLLSTRGLALIEGRIVEALLGLRMPRRPLFTTRETSWFEYLKDMLADRHTWSLLAYMLLQLPLGVFYFSLTVSLLATSLSLVVAPILQLLFDFPLMTIGSIGNSVWVVPDGLLAPISLGGFLILTATLHLARGLGHLHGRLARAMLISD